MNKNVLPRYMVPMLAIYINSGAAALEELVKSIAKVQEALNTLPFDGRYRASDSAILRRELLEDIERLVGLGLVKKVVHGGVSLYVLTPEGVRIVENSVPREIVERIKREMEGGGEPTEGIDSVADREKMFREAMAKEFSSRISHFIEMFIDRLSRDLRSCSTAYCVAMKLDSFYTYLREVDRDLGLKLSLKELLRAVLSDDRVLDKAIRVRDIWRLPLLVRERVQFRGLQDVVDVIENWVDSDLREYAEHLEKLRRLRSKRKRRSSRISIMRIPIIKKPIAEENPREVSSLAPQPPAPSVRGASVEASKSSTESVAEKAMGREREKSSTARTIALWIAIAIAIVMAVLTATLLP